MPKNIKHLIKKWKENISISNIGKNDEINVMELQDLENKFEVINYGKFT